MDIPIPTTCRLTNRINRRCSASQTEPAESDNIPLCSSALHPWPPRMLTSQLLPKPATR